MSTYWVALCEDEAVERGQITDLCQDILATQGVEAEIVPFSSADELRQAAEGKRIVFDLYLLSSPATRSTPWPDMTPSPSTTCSSR